MRDNERQSTRAGCTVHTARAARLYMHTVRHTSSCINVRGIQEHTVTSCSRVIDRVGYQASFS